MTQHDVNVRRGKHFGYWVVGRKASGGVFMYVWWPSQKMAESLARWVRGR